MNRTKNQGDFGPPFFCLICTGLFLILCANRRKCNLLPVLDQKRAFFAAVSEEIIHMTYATEKNNILSPAESRQKGINNYANKSF